MAAETGGTTLYNICAAVYGETGFAVPSQFIGSSNPDDIQITYLANRSAATLIELPLQRLTAGSSIAMTTATTYSLPSDFLAFVPDTMYAEGQLWPVDFPTDPSFWAYLQANNTPAGIRFKARIIGDKLNIWNPQPGMVIDFEYFQKYAILDGTTFAGKLAFTQDSDIWAADKDLIEMDLKWRFKKEKGLPDWSTDLAEFKSYKLGLLGRDSGAQTITYGLRDIPREPYSPLWVK